MSAQPPNPWHTAGRPRHSHSASRTPQSRSGTASPNQQGQPIQPPRQNAARPQQTSNVWTQRSSSASGSNGPTRAENAALGDYVLMNGFNAAEVKAMLSKEPMPASYKPAPASGAAQGSASAWGTKSNHMANNQPFFVQLAKQVATLEGGG